MCILQLSEMSLLLTVWSDQGELEPDQFVGEVLLDLSSSDLRGTPSWYQLQEHDLNCSSLPAPSPKCGRSLLCSGGDPKRIVDDVTVVRQMSKESSGRNTPDSIGEFQKDLRSTHSVLKYRISQLHVRRME